MKDKESGGNKGYAFVAFKSKEIAQKAIEELHSKELKVIMYASCKLFLMVWMSRCFDGGRSHPLPPPPSPSPSPPPWAKK